MVVANLLVVVITRPVVGFGGGGDVVVFGATTVVRGVILFGFLVVVSDTFCWLGLAK